MGTNKNRETSESGLKFIYLIPLYIDSSQKHKQQLLSKKKQQCCSATLHCTVYRKVWKEYENKLRETSNKKDDTFFDYVQVDIQ
jgi:hypothetical protein